MADFYLDLIDLVPLLNWRIMMDYHLIAVALSMVKQRVAVEEVVVLINRALKFDQIYNLLFCNLPLLALSMDSIEVPEVVGPANLVVDS